MKEFIKVLDQGVKTLDKAMDYDPLNTKVEQICHFCGCDIEDLLTPTLNDKKIIQICDLCRETQ